MRNTLKGFLAGLLAAFLCTGFCAVAKNVTEMIEVSYKDIKIYLDGKLLDPMDANGTRVEPFVYDGTTYLPVRAIGQAIGKKVSWNPAGNEIYLGEKPKKELSWMDICPPYQFIQGESYRLSRNKYFTIADQAFTEGFVLTPQNGKGASAEAYFETHGQYQSVTFKAGQLQLNDGGSIKTAKLVVHADDKVVYQDTIHYGVKAKEYTVPLNYALRVRFEVYVENSDDIIWQKTACGFAEGKFNQ